MNKYQDNIVKFSIIVFVALIVIIGYYFLSKNSDNYNSLKIDSSKYLVYTESKTQYGHYYQYIPFLNMKGDVGNVINQNIHEFVQYYNRDNIGITYDSSLNGSVLSLIVIVEDHSMVESATILHFASYNINLDRKEILSNETLFSYFHITNGEVEQILNTKIQDYYNILSSAGLIQSNKCDYYCFLKTRKIERGIEDVSYFVRDGKLIAFKPYTYLSFGEQDDMIYEFEITS